MNAACLSFYATKNITSGEGGAVVTNDRDLAERRRIGTLHRPLPALRRPGSRWKCSMSDSQAALLVGQLVRVEQILALRAAAHDRYEAALDNVDGVQRLLGLCVDSRPVARDLFL